MIDINAIRERYSYFDALLDRCSDENYQGYKCAPKDCLILLQHIEIQAGIINRLRNALEVQECKCVIAKLVDGSKCTRCEALATDTKEQANGN